MNLEKENAELSQQILVFQQLLGLVINQVGPVVITEEEVNQGLDGKAIAIDEDEQRNSITISLVDVDA